MMFDHVAPHIASIGIHKNGTWAAQRIVDTAKLSSQINMVCDYIRPYVPALLLDQFGNYVVQCCLALGPETNQFIFDAIVDNCWEIAQGRFGARAVRATLESPHVTKRQQVSFWLKIIIRSVLFYFIYFLIHFLLLSIEICSCYFNSTCLIVIHQC